MATNTVEATILGQAEGIFGQVETASVGSYSMDSAVTISYNSQTGVHTNCVIKFQVPKYTGALLSIEVFIRCTTNIEIFGTPTFDYVITSSPFDKDSTIVEGTVSLESGYYAFRFTTDITGLESGGIYYLVLNPYKSNVEVASVSDADPKHSIKLSYIDGGLVYIDNGSTLEAYSVYIDNGSSWDLYIPYIDNGSSWDICI